MREIKFRAWDKKEKIMVEPLSITWRCKEIYCVHRAKEHKGGVYLFNGKSGTDFELMQYTGLKDKNGKEIYEWDIVKSNDGEKNVVIFQSHAFITGAATFIEGYAVDTDGEVIGNYYENPELLK